MARRDKEDWTMIPVSKKLREALKDEMAKREDYESFISRLLREHKERKQAK